MEFDTNIDFDASGVHGVNRFVWAAIKAHTGATEQQYGGLIPMTTPQQTQEFNDMGLPYIIYNYRIGVVAGNPGIKTETVVYSVNAPDEGEVREILNIVDYYLSGMDESAEVLNDFINEPDIPAVFKEVDYKSIIPAGGLTGPTPGTQEGGIMDGRYEFTIRYTSSRVLGFR